MTLAELGELLVDCGRAINANNGRIALIEDALARCTSLIVSMMGPNPGLGGQPERPLWMGDLANDIMERWTWWEQEAGEAQQKSQEPADGDAVMLARIEECIQMNWGKP